MNSRERECSVAILKRARSTLEALPLHDHRGVCFAISSATLDMQLTYGDQRTIRLAYTGLMAWVHRMLGGHKWITGWLRTQHGIHVGPYEYDRLRATRLAWIDWMIKELSNDRGERTVDGGRGERRPGVRRVGRLYA